MIRNWNLIHTLPARSVQLLLRYVVILCQFQFQFQFGSLSLLFPKKKDRNLRLNFWQIVDWITPDTTRLGPTEFSTRLRMRTGSRRGPWTRLASGCWPSRPDESGHLSGYVYRKCLHTLTQCPKRKERQVKRNQKTIEKAAPSSSSSSMDEALYGQIKIHIQIHTQCIVSSIHALSHSDDDSPIRISGRSLTVYSCRKLSGTLTTFMAIL